MTREEFIKVLDEKRYSYEIQGNKIVVTSIFKGEVDLRSLRSLPPGVVFKNSKSVNLRSLRSLPRGIVFNNGWDVNLDSLTSLPPGVVFENAGTVYLDSLTSIPPGVVFENEGTVYLDSLIGGFFYEWDGNIEGIESKRSSRLLNLMISKGLFL